MNSFHAGMAAALLLLSGCATTSDYFFGKDNTEPPAELKKIEATAKIEKLWSADVGSGTDKQYLKLVPAFWNDRLFTADRDGRLTAIEAVKGKKLWSIDTKTEILGGPGVNDGIAAVGTRDGEVLAYNAADGQLLWRSQVSSEILSAPAVGQDAVVVRTIDGKLFCLEQKDGSRRWVYDRTVPILTLRGTSQPVLAADMAIAGFDSGKLVAVDLGTGRMLWETAVAVASGRSELERMVDIDSTPAVTGSTVYVASFHGRVAAISLESGNTRWAREISSHAGLTVDDRYVYLTDDKSHVWALDRFTGVSMWTQEELHARAVTAPAAHGDYIVVGDYDGYLHWLRREDGRIAGRVRIDSTAILTPGITIDGVLYAYSAAGKISALRSQ